MAVEGEINDRGLQKRIVMTGLDVEWDIDDRGLQKRILTTGGCRRGDK